MPIQVDKVVVGGHYLAGNEQERRVTKIENGKVWYEARSYRSKKEWHPGHAITVPPSIDSFAQSCYEVLEVP